MTRIRDLCHDDYTTRVKLRDQLRQLRRDAGLTQTQLGERLGLNQGNIGRFERHGVIHSLATTIARHARVLDHRLVLTPIGFPRPTRWRRREMTRHERTIHALLDSHNTAAFGGADGHMTALLIRDLAGIRIASGVTQERLAAAMGVGEQCVSQFEITYADPTLAVLQRYARGIARSSFYLGGYLAVTLEPLNPETGNHGVDRLELIPSNGG